MDKVKNITPLQIVNPEYSLESAATEIRTEIERKWEKDWSQLGVRFPVSVPHRHCGQ